MNDPLTESERETETTVHFHVCVCVVNTQDTHPAICPLTDLHQEWRILIAIAFCKFQQHQKSIRTTSGTNRGHAIWMVHKCTMLSMQHTRNASNSCGSRELFFCGWNKWRLQNNTKKKLCVNIYLSLSNKMRYAYWWPK